MTNEKLTRQQSAAMRGIAILAIVLHNYSHWLRSMVQENEYNFTAHNVDRLIAELLHPTEQLVVHLLSFFGHYGVPVFVFLSAYGLVMKYETRQKNVPQPPLPQSSADHTVQPQPSADQSVQPQSSADHTVQPQPSESSLLSLLGLSSWTDAVHFIASHYKKLFLMMIVGYAAFVMVDYMTPRPRHYEIWNVIGQLGMFSNLYADPDHAIWPGPYWYFGLMVQIYIVYRLVLYRGSCSLCGHLGYFNSQILTAALLFVMLIAQLFFQPDGAALCWYRYNVFGSLPVFAFGLLWTRARVSSQPATYKSQLITFIIAMFLIFFMSMWFVTWIFVPFAVCVATYTLVRILPQAILKPLQWVGSISAAMFVCHPITRKILIPISHRGDVYAGLLLFLVATIVLSVFFKKMIDHISAKA